MSIQLIQQYHNNVQKVIRYGGSHNEGAVRKPFHDLLEAYARQHNLEMIGELYIKTNKGNSIRLDGTLKDALQSDWGYWESKDEYDDLDIEIENKFANGYPCNNILFEDTQTAVLYQACTEIGRAKLTQERELDALLNKFVSYESVEVRNFREAIENFSRDVPELAETLRDTIRQEYDKSAAFKKAAADFLELCQEAINPSMEMADVREMIVQHVLTADIFVTIFDEPEFHRENVIAKELGTVVSTFYKGAVRRQINAKIDVYINIIKARAAQIGNHQEKQKFLKVLYENFYKAYNPKAADRLGIVYTPNEIVRFMIDATDTLCHRHFGKGLEDEGVEILDPATGTGTFITELIEKIPQHKLAYKYANELHCNEVSILPYYIANLNIEYTYTQKMGSYAPFENIVFVDTLDNMGFKTQYRKQMGLFGLTDENLERIQRQNERDISVIIGNPPYNAWQENYNAQNPNRPYKEVDKRIKETYVKQGTAQNKMGLYDMYTRFYRWATDRLGEDGIIAFITNNSFIDALTYDGFRKIVADEFSYIYLVDLGGNVRRNPKLSGPRNNVFAIQAGVTIGFMVRRKENDEPCQIFYARRPEMEEAPDKLRFLATHRLDNINFEHITPNRRHTWVNQAEEGFYDLLPLVDKEVKAGKSNEAVFKLFSSGVKTQRDEWIYDFSKEKLTERMQFFVDVYESTRRDSDYDDKMQIKWDRELNKYRKRAIKKEFEDSRIVPSLYRPFTKKYMYFDKHFNGMVYQMPSFFPDSKQKNCLIAFSALGNTKPFHCIASSQVVDLHLTGDSQCLPLYRYDGMGNRTDNITDWALAQFQARYAVGTDLTGSRRTVGAKPVRSVPTTITKQDIFHYVYAVLHNPAYREKYKLNLKREFPRIPFYDDFYRWAAWGKRLMELHLNYETITPHPLPRTDIDPDDTRKAYKARLKADKETGIIHLDTLTTLAGVPPSAWAYKLGNRSAIEWVLDRYKERKPRDPTIREKFNSYKFLDYKEDVVELIGKVTAVSVQTMAIIAEMENL